MALLRTSTPSRVLVRVTPLLVATAAVVVGGQHPAAAATGQSAVVTQDCASGGRIQETVVNNTATATTFTLNWPGAGTWTANVAANDSSHFYFTKPSGTAYTFHTTTPQGYDNTVSGTLQCDSALHSEAYLDCPRNADGSLPATHKVPQRLYSIGSTPVNSSHS